MLFCTTWVQRAPAGVDQPQPPREVRVACICINHCGEWASHTHSSGYLAFSSACSLAPQILGNTPLTLVNARCEIVSLTWVVSFFLAALGSPRDRTRSPRHASSSPRRASSPHSQEAPPNSLRQVFKVKPGEMLRDRHCRRRCFDCRSILVALVVQAWHILKMWVQRSGVMCVGWGGGGCP